MKAIPVAAEVSVNVAGPTANVAPPIAFLNNIIVAFESLKFCIYYFVPVTGVFAEIINSK